MSIAPRHKVATTWQGPYQVVASRNVTTLGVRMVGSNDEPRSVHWTHMKRFCGGEVNLPVDLGEQAQRGAAQFEVAESRDIRTTDEGHIEVRELGRFPFDVRFMGTRD